MLGLLGALVATSPAAAHGGAGEITVEDVTTDGLEVTYTMAEHYILDGHPATPSTFVATVTGLDGAEVVPPVELRPTDVEGRYTASFAVPEGGTYTVHFESSFPPASLEESLTLAAPAPDEAPATDDPSVPADAPEPDEAPGPPELVDEAGTVDETTSGPPAFLIGGLVAAGVLAVGALVAIVWTRRRRAT